MSEKKYSLRALNEQIKRVVALNFPDQVWVTAEIAQVAISKGIHYLQLVEKGEKDERPVAQVSAVIWRTDHRRLRRTLSSLDAVLQPGNKVLLQVEVNFSERYGLSLVVRGIDPAFTIGQLEMRRQRNVTQLKQEGLWESNKLCPVPLVWQRIAILSSPDAAGYADFIDQLNNNSFSYTFDTTLFSMAVQGRDVEREFLQQMTRILHVRRAFDCVVIIRGGGGKIDLAAFDSLEIGRAIARCPMPVVTGIGHDTDQSIADLVAHTALKTPTAAADFLILQNLAFENQVAELGQSIKLISGRMIREELIRLTTLERDLINHTRRLIAEERTRLTSVKNEIYAHLTRKLSDSTKELDHLAAMVDLLSLEATLQRGFSLTTKDGKVISTASQLEKGDRIFTKFFQGEKYSKVE